MKDFTIPEINEKVLRGEELTSEEVQLIFWDYDSVAEENGEHYRWWYPVYKVFQVDERYFQVWGMIGLTECQESEFEPQVAIEVEQREKVITEWRAIN
jgi:hypothetical protein